MKILLTFLVLLSFGATASESSITHGGIPGDLTLIADACEHPGHYNNQLPPANIQIHCAVLNLSWRMGKPGTMSFPGLRVLTVGVTTNKLGILSGNIDIDFPMGDVSFPCPTFMQTRGTGTYSYNVSCQDVVGMHNAGTTTVDYCNDNMLALIDEDESLLVTAPTGKTATGCGMMGGGHGQH